MRLFQGQVFAFQEGTSQLKDLPRYIPERLHWALHDFVTISWN